MNFQGKQYTKGQFVRNLINSLIMYWSFVYSWLRILIGAAWITTFNLTSRARPINTVDQCLIMEFIWSPMIYFIFCSNLLWFLWSAAQSENVLELIEEDFYGKIPATTATKTTNIYFRNKNSSSPSLKLSERSPFGFCDIAMNSSQKNAKSLCKMST